MPTGKDRLLGVLRQVLDLKKDKDQIISGAMGMYNIAGQQEIEVPGRPGFVWVRVRGQTSIVVQAFNDQVGLFFGMPVLMLRDELAPRYYKIIIPAIFPLK